MDGVELLQKIPNAIGFFAIGDFPGVITRDNQAWIFGEDELINPRPIGRREIEERGGEDVPADWAAELMQPEWLDFLSKKNDTSSTQSQARHKLATRPGSSKMKARVAKNRVIDIPM